MSSGKLQNKTTDGVVQSRKAAPPTSAEQDPLAVQQLADPLSDPLTDSSTVYGGGPSSMVDSAGSPGGDPTQFNGGQGSGDIQSIARSGIGGGGGSLPHLDTIQKSFGGHDLSGVQSHVGGKAASANKAMGSSAYATSNHVAFKSSPDLHTAAHEAAHVVQQRTGVSVPGGVGQAGDRYEKHADSVANAVVQGQSAEPLLSQFGGGGGAAVQHKKGKGGGGKAGGKGGAGGKAGDQAAMFEAAEKFVGKGPIGPHKYTPPTGLGGFDTWYWPWNGPDGDQDIDMSVKVQFINPVSWKGGKAVPADAECQDVADTINAFKSAKAKQNAIAQFQWGGSSKGWSANLQKTVVGAWGSNAPFFRVEKPGWRWVGAKPVFNVEVGDGVKGADDHVQVKAYKHPPTRDWENDPDTRGLEMGWGSYQWKQDRNQVMVLGSQDNKQTKGFSVDVPFKTGSSALDHPDANDRINDAHHGYFGAPGVAGSTKPTITLTGKTSATGSKRRNRILANKRVASVRNKLAALGWNVKTRVTSQGVGESQASTRAGEENRDRDRVVTISLDGSGQTTSVHEFGHAFGLADEYANRSSKKMGSKLGAISGTGGVAGEQSDHGGLAKKMGVKEGAIYENSENLMSVGNKLKPQHYATFHDALCKCTGIGEWKLGKAWSRLKAMNEVTPVGDFPDTKKDGTALA